MWHTTEYYSHHNKENNADDIVGSQDHCTKGKRPDIKQHIAVMEHWAPAVALPL